MREPIILLPGLLCDERLWAGVTGSLKAVAECIAFDLSTQTSIETMADAVLANAPPTFSLAGFSMGSQVALEVYARAPQRVQRLSLLSANAYGLTPLVREYVSRARDQIAAEGLDGYLPTAFDSYFSGNARANESLRQTFDDMAGSLGAAVAVRQMTALLSYGGFAAGLSSIGCPTTFICGERDLRTPPSLHDTMSASLAGSTVNVVSGVGHFTMLEAPQAVAQLLCRWLGT